jgi:excisionase family DNA binding protein
MELQQGNGQEQSGALGRLGYSAREVADALGCSERHVKNLMKSGAIPSVKLGERRIVRAADLQKALEDRVQKGWQSNKEAA